MQPNDGLHFVALGYKKLYRIYCEKSIWFMNTVIFGKRLKKSDYKSDKALKMGLNYE